MGLITCSCTNCRTVRRSDPSRDDTRVRTSSYPDDTQSTSRYGRHTHGRHNQARMRNGTLKFRPSPGPLPGREPGQPGGAAAAALRARLQLALCPGPCSRAPQKNCSKAQSSRSEFRILNTTYGTLFASTILYHSSIASIVARSGAERELES
jgi:hypothetical protein